MKRLSRILLILLWIATVSFAVLWAFTDNLPFDPEPITVILGLIASAVTALVQEYANALEKEEYSVSYALAYGYVHNFIEPVITQSLSELHTPKIYVFIPEDLQELEPRSIDRIMAQIRRQFHSEVMNLQLKEGRARDIITIQQHKNRNEKIMFDFPNTLITLNSLIDYKLESAKESFPDKARKLLGKSYIRKFQEALVAELTKKDLTQYVNFVNKELQFLNDPKSSGNIDT